MAEALIKGEAHFSSSDQEDLEAIDTREFDAVCFERNEKDFFERTLTPGYTLFCIGHLLYGATYGRVYTSTDHFRNRLEKEGVPFYDVDADVHEEYDLVPAWKQWILLIFSLGFGFFLAGIPAAGVAVVVQQWHYAIGAFLAMGVFSLLWGLAWAFAYHYTHGYPSMKIRDQFMANEVLRVASENGYDRVLVPCGDQHVDGIKRLLEETGWDVDTDRSDSWLAKAQRFLRVG